MESRRGNRLGRTECADNSLLFLSYGIKRSAHKDSRNKSDYHYEDDLFGLVVKDLVFHFFSPLFFPVLFLGFDVQVPARMVDDDYNGKILYFKLSDCFRSEIVVRNDFG